MAIQVGATVMLPGYAPYPRYGRVAKFEEDGRVEVTNVECGDPRCASEHTHSNSLWDPADIEAVSAYQARAGWEEGRLSSPNAVILK